MATLPVVVPGPIAVIPSAKAVGALGGQPMALITELAALAADGVLPARLDPGKRLILYGRRHVASLYPTKGARPGSEPDAYRLGHVEARRFRDEERLLTGALLVRAPQLRAYHDVRDLRGTALSAYWRQFEHWWRQLGALNPPEPAPLVPPQHAAFLDLLERVVTASRDIEIVKQDSAEPLHYRSRRSTREKRYSARGVYAFTLVRSTDIGANAVVFLADEPDLRGRVVRVDGDDVVVRFESTVDYQRIPPQGTLRALPSDRIYRAQLDAIRTLRDGKAVNAQLLDVLVDGAYRPYYGASVAPRRLLHPRQNEAFQRALTVPDLLLILGPPGTGKTTTITEIVLASAAAGRQALVTSHTNRAVDNVLEGLPAGIRAVRLGNVDMVTPGARRYLVDVQAEQIRNEVLAGTERNLEGLSMVTGADDPVGNLSRWLDRQLAAVQTADTSLNALDRALATAIDRAVASVAGRLRTAERELADRGQGVEESRARWEVAKAAIEHADRRASSRWVGPVYRWLADRRRRREVSRRQTLDMAYAAQQEARRRRDAVAAEAAALSGADPEVIRLTGDRRSVAADRATAFEDAKRAATLIAEAIRRLIPLQLPSGDHMNQWMAFAQFVRDSLERWRRRVAVLSDWQSRIAQADKKLQRELVRYTDVIAATCIGTATSELLADIDVELAIVDEAGQVSTQNLLVPLVRSRRVVLVGDHRQLPPFLDDDVRQWAAELGPADELTADEIAEVADLLRQSGFERLFGRAATENRVTLTHQHRMPVELAEFVSAQFYDGALTTDHPGGLITSLFRSPLALVDTSDRPLRERREQQRSRTETWNQPGYVNDLEADLIVRLVHYYTERADSVSDFAVIVPYRAQVTAIANRIRQRTGDPALAAHVGTVDSFQGGERDVIIYGFTRSNHQGRVGFLRELRRLNVAVTRARRQLVLVGDSETLRNADDDGFAQLFRDLIEHLGRCGDIRRSRELASALAASDGHR